MESARCYRRAVETKKQIATKFLQACENEHLLKSCAEGLRWQSKAEFTSSALQLPTGNARPSCRVKCEHLDSRGMSELAPGHLVVHPCVRTLRMLISLTTECLVTF